MFYWSLALKVGFKAFSLKKESPRFPVPKRIIAVLVMFPLFLLLTATNRFFMLLDYMFFPSFIKTRVDKPVFIIGVARSATTYLFKTMAHDREQFTAFRLWEILFAPSIIQKYFWQLVIAIDRKIGRPLYYCAGLFDRLFLGKITKVHETGLTKVEEDEILLLSTFSSVYLTFFFPDLKEMDPLIFFDEQFPEGRKAKVMRYYKRCVQRHLFVFGNNGKTTFLSKNPAFISKMNSIATYFPDGRLIYMLRSPYKTIPSTISMNANVYSIFSRTTFLELRNDITREVVVKWYEGAERSLQKEWRGRYYVAPFKRVTKEPRATVQEIYHFLNLVPSPRMIDRLDEEQELVNSYTTEHTYNKNAGIADDAIQKRLAFIVEGEYKDLI